jgi:hypothetical protein
LALSRTAFAVLGAWCLWAAVPTQLTAEEMVLIERRIDTRYEKTYQAYEALLHSSLKRIHTVRPNETLQSITTTLYEIGPKSSPRAYKALEATIVENNQLKDPNDLRVGETLVLPDIAPRKAFDEVFGNHYYNQPKISASPALKDVSSGRVFNFDQGAFTALPTVTDLNRKASAFVTQWRWVPASQAATELASTSAGGPPLEVRAGPVEVQFSQGPAAAAPPDEIAGDIAFVKNLLSQKQPTHDTVVYVLDDVWPSQAAFVASREFFVAAAKVIGGHFGLGDAQWPQGFAGLAAQTNFPFLAAGESPHAPQVEGSIAPLRLLTPRVKVIYLPLVAEQEWSKEFLHELMRLAFTARAKGAGLDDPTTLPSADILKTANQLADDITAHLPSHLVKDYAHTDQAVIGSLFLFAQLYARASTIPYFVSLSWTARKYTFTIAPEPDAFGVSLAAVGNTFGYDVIGNKVQLAMRARESPGDVVAVMNSHPDGTVACSSDWVIPSTEVFYGFVYDGFPVEGGCGTSFSTPRVAWYLALRQGYDAPIVDQSAWFISYRKFLLSLQNPAASGYQRYWLSLQRLFNGI